MVEFEEDRVANEMQVYRKLLKDRDEALYNGTVKPRNHEQ